MRKTFIRFIFPVLITVGSSVLISACEGRDREFKTITLPEGIWQEEGTGYTLYITKNDTTIYRTSKQTCSQTEYYDSLDKALKVLTYPKISFTLNDITTLSILPLGGTVTDRKRFRRLKQLPLSCQIALDPDVFDTISLFEHSWHVFNAY
ncbi:hypothetical protein O1D97_18045 [Marinomonas sp. 15G1-11]|uniref:Lipoprotein n=1 Tax=Marinomonas phaeophyticola TaxID=3004091 RepID=A0ABT4JYH6_9GAMM|nr:hypothetical protein [Marinomonas sp. 15G1-11]MCZ2723460.1 hypothetical protein [Marinomonas sp. 15G1-11]